MVGDHSSIYMNTEEAATRMAEDGVNHNIEEQLSQRMGVSYQPTERTRAIQLQRSMQSSMRSSKKKDKSNIVSPANEATSFGD